MPHYNIVVVDDSAFMRKLISDMISADPELNVIETARNGLEAVEAVQRLRPDAVTMDVEMPGMNGLAALREIMRTAPAPVVMLSSLTDDGADETIQALASGAVDFIRKPSGSISMDLHKVRDELIVKLKTAVKVGNLQKLAETHPEIHINLLPKPRPKPVEKKRKARYEDIVAIGTSTGGPRALQQVLSELPEDFPAPILIVQHMPPKFTRSLAQRLNGQCSIRVKEAEDREEVQPSVAYIAPGGKHMTAQPSDDGGIRIHLSDEPPRSGHRPSVDVLFESLAPIPRIKKYAVLMTGMGGDGAQGMKTLLEAGAVATIAESEETCIVYGMPRKAVELHAVRYLLPVDQIADKLVELLRH